MQLRDTNQGSARLSGRGRRMELLLTVAIMRRRRGRAKDNMQIGGVHGISDGRDRPIGRPLTSQSTKDRRRSSADFKAWLASEPPMAAAIMRWKLIRAKDDVEKPSFLGNHTTILAR